MFAFFSPGPMELCIIAGIAVLLFGNKFPSIARSMGKSIVEFKKGVNDINENVKEIDSEVKSKVKELK